ncbi:Rv3654c family TadE-like protein [Jatrophihabitans sp. DSM 45814]
MRLLRRAVVGESSANDVGSATLWVFAFATLIMTVAIVGVARTAAVLARHRAERSADLAALAAAQQIGTGGDSCAAARRIAASNQAAVASCVTAIDASGRTGTVTVVVNAEVRLPIAGARQVTARARAGRLPAVAGAANGQRNGAADGQVRGDQSP